MIKVPIGMQSIPMDHRTDVMNDELFMSMLVIELSITTSQFFRSLNFMRR